MRLDPDVVERAAEAWAAAAEHATGKPGRDDGRRIGYVGTSADEIIEAAAPFARDPALYRAYETAVRDAALGRLGRDTPKPTGRKRWRRVSDSERTAIIAALEAGEVGTSVAARFDRSIATIYDIRRACA